MYSDFFLASGIVFVPEASPKCSWLPYTQVGNTVFGIGLAALGLLRQLIQSDHRRHAAEANYQSMENIVGDLSGVKIGAWKAKTT